MNALSVISIALATSFLIGGIYCLTRIRKSQLNLYSFLVLSALGWWNFCYAFFFSAETQAALWFWHHLAAIGWTGFVAVTVYYFIVLTGINVKMSKPLPQIIFWGIPLAILAYNLFGNTTSLAVGFVRSSAAGQWTYVNTPSNQALWVYLTYLVSYFAFAFYLLMRWSSEVKHRLKKQLAMGFVLLDALTIVLGALTDVLLPLTSPVLPAVASICTSVFGAGYFLIIIRFDLFNVNRVIADRDIIELTTDAVMVIDEDGEVLYCNNACAKLLSTVTYKLIGAKLSDYIGDGQYRKAIAEALKKGDSLNDTELSVGSEGAEKRLLMSASIIRDKQKDYLGTVISLRDITLLSRLQEQYRRLAYIDTLTGLPNRRKTFEVLSELAEAYANTKRDFFILYMDIDHFKDINDCYGHDAGDEFLMLIAERLKREIKGSIRFLGRLSGDELLMIGEGDTTEKNITACEKSIKESFKKEFVVDSHHIMSGISIGHARYSDYGDIDTMVHHADERIYGAKHKNHTRAQKRVAKLREMNEPIQTLKSRD